MSFLRRQHPDPDEERSGGEPSRRAAPAVEADLKRSLQVLGEQIDATIAHAQHAAGGLRREAEVEADRYLAERRREADRVVSEQMMRMEGLLSAVRAIVRAQLARIEAESEAMIRAIEDAVARPEAFAEAEAPAAAPAPPDARPAPAPSAEPAGVSAHPARGSDRDAALLRAAQLAAGAKSREQVEAALREQVGPAEAREIVDTLFRR